MSARADAPDFGLDAETWNGIGYLATTAREAKVKLQVLDVLDFGALDPEEALLIVAPDRGELAADLQAFVTDGGGVLLALDVGASPELAAAFGIRVDPGRPSHNRYFREHPGFPALTPPPCPDGGLPPCRKEPPRYAMPFGPSTEHHFLWFNVAELVLNHPVSLTRMETAPDDTTVWPVIRFDTGSRQSPDAESPGRKSAGDDEPGFAMEVRMGRGQALVVGDASVFIDDMQRNAYGDKQFAANAMRWFCGAGPCTLSVVTPKTRLVGTYTPRHGQRLFGMEGIVAKGLDALNDAAREVNAASEQPAGQIGAGLALLLLALLACFLLPWPESALRFIWESRKEPTSSMDDYWASALASAGPDADFRGPATALVTQLHLAASAEERGGVATRVLASQSATLAKLRSGQEPISLAELDALWTASQTVGPRLSGAARGMK